MRDIKKLKIYLDVDSTVINSTECMARWYNKKYYNHPDFKEAIGKNIYYFNGEQEMPLITLEDINEIFASDFFFKNVEIYEDCIDTLIKLDNTDHFVFTFLSIGTSRNIANKTLFLEKNFPFVRQHEFIVKNFGAKTKMGKDKFVKDGLLIDDHQRNLNGSAMFEVMFKGEGEKDWNKDFKLGQGKAITNNWRDMYYIIEEMYNDYIERYIHE